MQELRKNREIQLNQQTIQCQVLADLIKIWSCLIFIKLYIVHPNIPQVDEDVHFQSSSMQLAQMPPGNGMVDLRCAGMA